MATMRNSENLSANTIHITTFILKLKVPLVVHYQSPSVPEYLRYTDYTLLIMVHHGKHSDTKLDQSPDERKDIWIKMVESLIKSVGDSNEDLTIALGKICQAKKVPRRWTKLNKPKFASFLKYLRHKITPIVTDQLWELFSKAIQAEQKKPIQRNTKPNKTGDKDEKEIAKLIVADDTLNPVKQSTKVKWSPIGKQILGNQDDNELSLKKFQKKIVKEYRKQTGKSSDKESVQALWSKCLKELSKNSKFQFVDDKIKLV